MLLDSKLPKNFWGEAISTAIYLKNRSPVKALKKAPFEVWHAKKPRVNHLRVFGSDAYTHIPRDERAKFDSKCIMVGYGNVTKGYRLYDATQGKIFHSRDVQFNEQVNQSEGAQVKSDYQFIADFSEAPEVDTGGDDITQPEHTVRQEILTKGKFDEFTIL